MASPAKNVQVVTLSIDRNFNACLACAMNYNYLAPLYHLIEKLTMGRDLQKARTAHLERLQASVDIQRALLIGEGDGSFLLRFIQLFPDTEVTVIEASDAMVRRAQVRLSRAGFSKKRVTWVVSDLADHSLKEDSFDLIVTLFFFDNFSTDVALKYYRQLVPATRADAHWLFADFHIPTAGWRKLRARIWLNILYAFFRVFAGLQVNQLPSYKVILEDSKLECLALDQYCGDMLFSGLYRLRL